MDAVTTRPAPQLAAALSLSAAFPGLWATLSPSGFFGDFPGLRWVAELPPYNEHLVRDAGAFYLAFALLFGWAARRPSRELLVPLAAAWSLFSLLHLVYHLLNLDGFGVLDAALQTASLAAVLAAGVALLVLSGRPLEEEGGPALG